MSVTSGLAATVLDAMGPTGRLSIPVPMMLVQLLFAAVASGPRRRPALIAGVPLAVVGVVAARRAAGLRPGAVALRPASQAIPEPAREDAVRSREPSGREEDHPRLDVAAVYPSRSVVLGATRWVERAVDESSHQQERRSLPGRSC